MSLTGNQHNYTGLTDGKLTGTDPIKIYFESILESYFVLSNIHFTCTHTPRFNTDIVSKKKK